MQPTQKYYEADAYRREADAVILAAEPDGRGGGKLALDGTVFYPEGGGQPDRKSTRLNSSHDRQSRMPSSA